LITKVYGEVPEFTEELLSAGGIGGFGNSALIKKIKSSGDSSSTSPERSRKDDTMADVEKRHLSSEFHHEPTSLGPTPSAGYAGRKSALMAMTATAAQMTLTAGRKNVTPLSVAAKKKSTPPSSPMLKYLKIRVRLTYTKLPVKE
jgi:hypothetical protein